MAIELMFTACGTLLILTTILQRKNYYLILQVKKQAERLIFPSPCDYVWWDQDLDLRLLRRRGMSRGDVAGKCAAVR